MSYFSLRANFAIKICLNKKKKKKNYGCLFMRCFVRQILTTVVHLHLKNLIVSLSLVCDMFTNKNYKKTKPYSKLLAPFDISNDEKILFNTPLVPMVGTIYCMKGAEGGSLN